MKKLVKIFACFIAVFIGLIAIMSCGKKTVSFDKGYAILLKSAENASSLTSFNESYNYYYDCYNQAYTPDLKKLFVFNESYENFSYFKDKSGATTALIYKQNNDYFTNLDYKKVSLNLLLGKANDNIFYSILEKDERTKNGKTISSVCERYKHNENNSFVQSVESLNTEYYYGDKLNQLYTLWNSREGILHLNKNNTKFYKKSDIYNLTVKAINTVDGQKIEKTLNLSFDDEKIHFAETIINSYDKNGLLIEKLWNKLTVKFKSGAVTMPLDLDEYTTTDEPLKI